MVWFGWRIRYVVFQCVSSSHRRRVARIFLLLVRLPVRIVMSVRCVVFYGQNSFDFRHRNDGQEAAEQQIQAHENTEAAEQHQSVIHCRSKISP